MELVRREMSWDRPCFVLFSAPLKGVKITLQMIRNFLLLHYALLLQKCGASCACGWHWQQSFLERELSGLAFASVDGCLTSSSFWSYREREKSVLLCFLTAVMPLQGFPVGLQIGIIQSRITQSLFGGDLKCAILSFGIIRQSLKLLISKTYSYSV